MSGPIGILILSGGVVLIAVADVLAARVQAAVESRRTRKALGR